MSVAAGIPILAVAVTAAIYALAAGHQVMPPPLWHVVIVGAAGVLAAVAGASLASVAARLRDGRAVLIGTAFSLMATLLVIHALSTPGVLMGDNGVTQVAGALNIPLGAVLIGLAALPGLRRPRRTRRLMLAGHAIVLTAAVGGGLALLVAPSVPVLPRPAGPAAIVLILTGSAVLGLVAWRAARTFALTRRTSDALVAVGIVCLGAGQVGLLVWTMMDLAWWIAHVFEVAGIGLVAIPAALDLRHGVASRPLVGDLRARALVDHEAVFVGARVRALLARLGEKDPSTLGHTRRVAELAVRLGERLDVPGHRLRHLALGGLLHDMGKLAIPAEILLKPERLTDDEFAVIRTHPMLGRDLLVELGGFAAPVLALVEGHHERLDGAGYPHGRGASELPLELRILSVADAFDALTDDRVYRDALRPSRALEVLVDGMGTAFDRTCVAALASEVAEEWARTGQWGSEPVAAGGRDSSASEEIASWPSAAVSSTSVASSWDRA